MAGLTLKERMAQKKAAIAAATGRRQDAEKIPQGKSRWRILPSWRKEEGADFWHDFAEHFVKNEKKETKFVYVCVEKTYGRECPICDTIREAIKLAKTDERKELINESRSTGRVLVNAIRIDKDPNTPVLLALSPTTFDQLINIYQENIDPDNDNFNIITDLENGVDVVITREGTGKKTEYSVQPALKGSKPVPAGVMDKILDLDQYVAQEHDQKLISATNAIRTYYLGAPAKSADTPTKVYDDDAFDDDVPHYSSPKDVEAIDAEFETVQNSKEESKMSDDELSAILEELE